MLKKKTNKRVIACITSFIFAVSILCESIILFPSYTAYAAENYVYNTFNSDGNIVYESGNITISNGSININNLTIKGASVGSILKDAVLSTSNGDIPLDVPLRASSQLILNQIIQMDNTWIGVKIFGIQYSETMPGGICYSILNGEIANPVRQPAEKDVIIIDPPPVKINPFEDLLIPTTGEITITSGMISVDDNAVTTPTLAANTTAPTNGNVTVTINYSTNSVVKQYKIGSGGTWINYTGPVIMSSNDTVYAKGQGSTGYWSTEVSLVINNIDKVAPIISISSYTTAPTNADITVAATTNEGTLNVASHTFTENGSFDFVSTDNVGNVTTKTVTISNLNFAHD